MQTGRLFQAGIESPARRLDPRLPQRAARATCRRTSCCRARSATPAATCRTARRPASSASCTTRSSSNADPVGPGLQGARPAAARLPDRDPRRQRRNLRELVDGAGEGLRSEPRRPAARTPLRPGLHADVVAEGARGVRPVEGARRAEGPATAATASAELPAGPAADRGRRAVRDREHVRDGVQRDHLGHPRLGAVHRSRRIATCSARCSTRRTRRCSRT